MSLHYIWIMYLENVSSTSIQLFYLIFLTKVLILLSELNVSKHDTAKKINILK